MSIILLSGAAAAILLTSACLVCVKKILYAATLPCRPLPRRGEVIHVNGFDLCYTKAGIKTERPAIVLIHGGPGMSGRYFADAFKFLEKGYRVISYDQRGSGFSQFRPGFEFYTLDALADELEALRGRLAGPGKIIIVGHSFGGLVAMRYASKYGDHLEKMVLISPLSRKISAYKLIYIGLKVVFNNGFQPPRTDAFDRWVLTAMNKLFVSSFYDRSNIRFLDLGQIRAATMLAAIHSIRAVDLLTIYKKIKVKTLIIFGDKEWINSPEKDHVALHAEIENSSLVKFNRSGHWVFLEEPDEFRETISRFLETG
jgi:proline iminopeptidase